jgi:hypothetical protein
MPRVWNKKRRRVTSAGIRCSLPLDGVFKCTEQWRRAPDPSGQRECLHRLAKPSHRGGERAQPMPMAHDPAGRWRNACGVGNTGVRGLLVHDRCLNQAYADVLAEQHAFNKLRPCQQSVWATPKGS